MTFWYSFFIASVCLCFFIAEVVRFSHTLAKPFPCCSTPCAINFGQTELDLMITNTTAYHRTVLQSLIHRAVNDLKQGYKS
eukprot:m.74699 g.74699  ORF g.74699 m.74699 type:complete len:81 (-) comp11817_c0_seq3:22-264(-)